MLAVAPANASVHVADVLMNELCGSLLSIHPLALVYGPGPIISEAGPVAGPASASK